jgi:hypothetical protein
MSKNKEISVVEAFPTAFENQAQDAGKGLCYFTRVADALKQVAGRLPVENGKIVLSWPVARDVINLLWAEFKKSAKDCDGKEIVLKRPTGFLGLLPAVAAWLGLRIWD